ncbi:restriction endonuclease [Sulfurimonas sp. SAG-AH-194-L11]|nr:restriction endonuclease [Sulfurimonas sp. SAG-AH-194-L11]MDF1877001.1 restriction endonuclease [Sulfurimonas sp. SAG-AH-194-L11]
MFTIFKTIMHTPTYCTVSDIAIYFNISARELNKIFEQLKWAEKQDKWWVATNLGIKHGAKQEYSPRNKQKFIKWDSKLKENIELKNIIKKVKKISEISIEKKVVKQTRYEEKVKKGTEYEEFIARYYEKLGYYVWEHGKDKGRKDNGIDLIAKKDKEIIFMQCKNWSVSSSYKISHKELKSTRQDVSDYIEKNKIFESYNRRIIYILSNDVLHKSAYHYLEEYKNSIECQIIPFST